MRPARAEGAAAMGWGRVAPTRPSRRRWRAPTLRPGARAAALAGTVLVLVVGAAAYVAERPGAPGRQTPAPAAAAHGTAFLGTATCATWQAAGDARRLTIIGTLAAAATQPDPENPGATLSQGAAYGLFERACTTHASRSVLLYEAYNRAASMSAARLAVGSSWGPAPHL